MWPWVLDGSMCLGRRPRNWLQPRCTGPVGDVGRGQSGVRTGILGRACMLPHRPYSTRASLHTEHLPAVCACVCVCHGTEQSVCVCECVCVCVCVQQGQVIRYHGTKSATGPLRLLLYWNTGILHRGLHRRTLPSSKSWWGVVREKVTPRNIVPLQIPGSSRGTAVHRARATREPMITATRGRPRAGDASG